MNLLAYKKHLIFQNIKLNIYIQEPKEYIFFHKHNLQNN